MDMLKPEMLRPVWELEVMVMDISSLKSDFKVKLEFLPITEFYLYCCWGGKIFHLPF